MVPFGRRLLDLGFQEVYRSTSWTTNPLNLQFLQIFLRVFLQIFLFRVFASFVFQFGLISISKLWKHEFSVKNITTIVFRRSDYPIKDIYCLILFLKTKKINFKKIQIISQSERSIHESVPMTFFARFPPLFFVLFKFLEFPMFFSFQFIFLVQVSQWKWSDSISWSRDSKM